MTRLIITLAAGGAAAAGFAALPTAAAAQQNSVAEIIVYGTDPCPRSTDDQVVVCARRPEEERFRIPKELREPMEITPENQSWAVRQDETLDAGAMSIGSCSTVGPGGGTGCFVRGANAANAEARSRARSDATIPEPK